MSVLPPPSIELAGVSKWYGEVLGLNDVTASFGPGVHGLLGPNGAGKSTMLKLATGMLRPSLGTVKVCGLAPASRPGVMRRVGLVPEQDALYAKQPILAVVTYLTRIQGFGASEARKRARRSLEYVGLGHVLDRAASGFSKGMRQRAKLAQALAHDPDVIVLDEPLNGMDPPGRREYSELVRELGAQGRCLLVSSHILHEVAALAERIVVIHSGRLLADGTPREIREDLSEFPLVVQIKTPDAARLGSEVVALEGVKRVEILDDGVEVLTQQANTLFDHVAAASEAGLRVDAVLPMDEDLEAVFRYLIQ